MNINIHDLITTINRQIDQRLLQFKLGASALPNLKHAIDSLTSHDIGGLTNTYLVKSNGSKVVPATNTDAQVAAAVTASHAAVTLDADAQTLLNLSTQAIGIPTKSANLIWASPASGGAAVPTWRKIIEADFAFTNISTANAITGVHGLCPALSNDPAQFLNGQGSFTNVTSGAAAGYVEQSFTAQTSVTVTHNLNGYPIVQVLVDGTDRYVEIPYTIQHTSKNALTVTFSVSTSGIIIASLGSPGTPSVTTQVVDYTATANDRYIIAAGHITVTLPASAGIVGREYVVKRSFVTDDVTIIGTGGDTIDGDASLILVSDHSAARLIAISGGWLIA